METTLLRKFTNAAQHNLLVHAPLKMNITEARLFSLALSNIHRNTDELPPILIRFEDVFPNESGSNYELLEEACKGLMEKTVVLRSVRRRSKVTQMYSIISNLKLESGTGLITGAFDPEIAPYLLDLVGQFTTMEVEKLLTLKNPHSHRFAWILKSHMLQGEYEVKLDDFREMVLGKDHLKHYPEYFDFKRFILQPVLKELNDVTGFGWGIEVEEVKLGQRRVYALRFTIPLLEEESKKSSTKAPKPTKTRELVAAPAPKAPSAPPVVVADDGYLAYLQTKPNAKPAQYYTYMVTRCEFKPADAKLVLEHVLSLDLLDDLKRAIGELTKTFNADDAKAKGAEGKIINRRKYGWKILRKTFHKLPELD